MAITVVLAAVLYVMVTGLIGGGGTQPPTVGLGPAEATQIAGEYTVDIGGVDRSVTLTSFQVVLQNTTGSPTTLFSAALADGSVGTSGGVTLLYDDLNGDGKLTGGDFFTVRGVANPNSYNIILLWKASGGRITERTVP
ncbi:MAG: hypothetical protein HY557_00070 [Euryarchaeota archaeon]|nr:hypothetical protein [Euryarchaeota archaeon]